MAFCTLSQVALLTIPACTDTKERWDDEPPMAQGAGHGGEAGSSGGSSAGATSGAVAFGATSGASGARPQSGGASGSGGTSRVAEAGRSGDAAGSAGASGSAGTLSSIGTAGIGGETMTVAGHGGDGAPLGTAGIIAGEGGAAGARPASLAGASGEADHGGGAGDGGDGGHAGAIGGLIEDVCGTPGAGGWYPVPQRAFMRSDIGGAVESTTLELRGPCKEGATRCARYDAVGLSLAASDELELWLRVGAELPPNVNCWYYEDNWYQTSGDGVCEHYVGEDGQVWVHMRQSHADDGDWGGFHDHSAANPTSPFMALGWPSSDADERCYVWVYSAQ